MVALREGKLTLANIYTYEDGEQAYRLLYQLLKERPKYANISHKKLPKWEDHLRFVNDNPYVVWELILVGDEPVGAIYLTYDNEIGIAILKGFQGKGYAKKALKKFINECNLGHYLANIAPGNKKSHQLFKSMGFTPIQVVYKKVKRRFAAS